MIRILRLTSLLRKTSNMKQTKTNKKIELRGHKEGRKEDKQTAIINIIKHIRTGIYKKEKLENKKEILETKHMIPKIKSFD